MRATCCRFTIALVLASVMQTLALAAAPIRFLPRQVILACPHDSANRQPGAVCPANVLVGGGQTLSGYTFSVRPGTALPPGISLASSTGIITAEGDTSVLPPANTKRPIYLTVRDDAGRTANGVVTLVVQKQGGSCGCPGLKIAAGPLPLAYAKEPYSVTLALVGPPPSGGLRPSYVWKVAKGSSIPPGLVLDQTRGVLRGTPAPSASRKAFNFSVEVTDTHTRQQASGLYTLYVY